MFRYVILGLFLLFTEPTNQVVDSVVNKPITPQAEPSYFREDAVPNPDIRERMPICGETTRTSSCIFYFKNTSKFDKLAEDFFEEASHQTGRAKYLIHIENQHYAKYSIAPGKSVAIRIPALR